MPPREPGALFDRYAATWDDRPLTPEIQRKLEQVVVAGAPPEKGTLLDVGTGTGILIPFLLAHQPESVWACDVSEEMLKRAQAKFGQEERVRLVKADAARLDLDDASVDVVYWNALYPHLEDRAAALAEAWRVLRPGGRLVVSHVMGRQHVNEVHANADTELRHHHLPPAAKVSETLREASFDILHEQDKDAFYLITVRKPEVT